SRCTATALEEREQTQNHWNRYGPQQSSKPGNNQPNDPAKRLGIKGNHDGEKQKRECRYTCDKQHFLSIQLSDPFRKNRQNISSNDRGDGVGIRRGHG